VIVLRGKWNVKKTGSFRCASRQSGSDRWTTGGGRSPICPPPLKLCVGLLGLAWLAAVPPASAEPTVAENYLAAWNKMSPVSPPSTAVAMPDIRRLPVICDPRRDPEILRTGPAYGDCTQREAAELERSGESAENVAIAAISLCRIPKAAFTRAIVACGGERAPDATFSQLDPVLKNYAIGVVVKLRAAHRHNP
jgi:hypothetical protein